jgi:hypothetical protein
MKRILLPFVLLGISSLSCAHEKDWMVSLKQGYFVPQSKVLRSIFNCCGSKGGYFVEGALRYNVWHTICHDLYIELNGSYFGRKGRSLLKTLDSHSCPQSCECDNRVSFKVPTIGLGLKYFYWFHDRISFFIGGGIKGFFVRIKNDSPYVPPCDNKNTAGGFVSTGLLFDVYKGLFFELFADYLGARLKCPCSDAASLGYKLNVGGFAGGLGIGYNF